MRLTECYGSTRYITVIASVAMGNGLIYSDFICIKCPSNVQSPCSCINCQGLLIVDLPNKVTIEIKQKQRVQCSSPPWRQQYRPVMKKMAFKSCVGVCTENGSFPLVVDTLFVDWLVVFAALSNSFDTKLLQQVVKHPMKGQKVFLLEQN